MKSIGMFGVILLLLATAAWAQEPPPGPPGPPGPSGEGMMMMHRMPGPGFGHGGMPMGNWWKNSDIIQQLQLTDQQRQQLEQTFVQHRLRLVDERAAVEKQEIQLQSLMDRDRPPESEVMAQLDKLQGARGQLEKEFTAMTLDFRKILTPEQWRKLDTMSHQRRRMGCMRDDRPERGGPPEPLEPPTAPPRQ